MTASAKEFCEGPKTIWLAEMLEEALSYKYDEKPNYSKLHFLLNKILIENNISPYRGFIFSESEDENIRHRPEDGDFSEFDEQVRDKTLDGYTLIKNRSF